MSETTPVASTTTEPSLALKNIVAHPGSTYAGVGVVALAIGQVVNAGAMPTSFTGWLLVGGQLLLALGAAFGK